MFDTFFLRTEQTSLATVMRGLLTGYAVSYNRRHRRHGHLFQKIWDVIDEVDLNVLSILGENKQ